MNKVSLQPWHNFGQWVGIPAVFCSGFHIILLLLRGFTGGYWSGFHTAGENEEQDRHRTNGSRVAVPAGMLGASQSQNPAPAPTPKASPPPCAVPGLSSAFPPLQTLLHPRVSAVPVLCLSPVPWLLLMLRAATNSGWPSQSKGSPGRPETFASFMAWPSQLTGEVSALVSPGHYLGKGPGQFTHLFH